MGDVCSITFLAVIMQQLYEWQSRVLNIVLILAFISIAPVFGYFARQNRYTKSVIYTGWSAILGAVIVEQPGGMVMQSAFEKYKVISTFQPLVNGLFVCFEWFDLHCLLTLVVLCHTQASEAILSAFRRVGCRPFCIQSARRDNCQRAILATVLAPFGFSYLAVRTFVDKFLFHFISLTRFYLFPP